MLVETIYQAVLEGDIGGTESSVQAALDSGVSAVDILHTALIPAMGEVGHLFKEGEYFVPEMLIAARVMKTGGATIKPLFVNSGIEPVG